MIDKKTKLGLLIGAIMIVIGFLLWSELSFSFIGFGVVVIGISLMMHINKNN